MAGTLSQIIQQEYKTKGVVSGLASGIGKTALEKADLRNLFFGGSGSASIIGRKIFGKGYSATKRDTTPTRTTLDQSDVVLSEIRDNMILSAKNSMALPMIAGQMNIMQKNIAKLVQIQKVKPTQKADAFFTAAKFRENAYEASIGSTSRKNTSLKTPVSPSQVSGGESSSFLGGLTAGLLGSTFLKLAKRLTPLIAIAGLVGIALTSLSGVIAKIVNFFANSWLGKKLGMSPMDQAGDIGSFDQQNDIEKSINSFSSDLINAGAIAGATISGAYAIKGISKASAAAKGTRDAILDARTMSVQQMQKSKPTTKWGRFLRFMAIKNPNLFGRVGLRLAQAGALAAIPIGGWFGAIFTILGSVGLAWAVYTLWKEFSNSPEEIEGDNTPEQVDEEKGPVQLSGPPDVSMDRSSVAQRKRASAPTQQSKKQYGRFASLGGQQVTGETTWNQLTKEQQDAVLAEQRNQEGFKEGSLTYDLNNPGAILYSSRAAQFGGVPDDTGRGQGDLKGKFAKFPTLEAGIEAQRDLWSRVYGNVSINEALKKWTGNEQSAESSYGKSILSAANAVTPSSTVVASSPSMTGSKIRGSSVASSSTEVADANRQLAMQNTPPIINQDNRTFNNQTGQTAHGSTNPFAYDRELFQALVGNVT